MLKLVPLALITLTALTACGGGGLVAQAKTHADRACACVDAACAKETVAAMNKISFQSQAEKDALSEADDKEYLAHIDRMSQCRDAKK